MIKYVKRMYILTSESKTRITVGQYSLVTNELWLSHRHTKVCKNAFPRECTNANIESAWVPRGAACIWKSSFPSEKLGWLVLSECSCI